MITKHERFLKWCEENEIALNDFQKEMIKNILEKKIVIVPRQHGRAIAMDALCKFYINGGEKI